MTESIVDQVVTEASEVQRSYHRLVLLVGPRGSGKTKALSEAATRLSVPYVNVGLELPRRLLDMTITQRALTAQQTLDDILAEAGGDVVVLDNTDVLFAPALRQKALPLLRQLSRNRTVVAAWTGAYAHDFVTRAVPGHPEYVRERADGIVIVSSSAEHYEPQP
jgi:hypothetical protein